MCDWSDRNEATRKEKSDKKKKQKKGKNDVSIISNKSCIEIYEESGTGVTKAALLKERMSHNANNESEKEQNAHQDVDEEDDI